MSHTSRRIASGRRVSRRCAFVRSTRMRRNPSSRQYPAARWRSAPSTSRCRRCRSITADWNWKHNHDTGHVYEQLFAADLSKSKRLGGKHPFYADAWICRRDAIRGELAESWEWKENPLRARDQAAQGRDVSGQARA